MMKNRKIALFLLLNGFLFLYGCATTHNIRPDETTPDWVKRVPRERGRLCAIGASEPTYFREDGKTYAAENARKELARSLHVDIKSIMVDITTERGGDIAEGSIIEASSWASEAVLKESEITSYWYDEEGTASFKKKGITYALACMPLKNTVQEISRKLNEDEGGSGILERLYNKIKQR